MRRTLKEQQYLMLEDIKTQQALAHLIKALESDDKEETNKAIHELYAAKSKIMSWQEVFEKLQWTDKQMDEFL